MSEFLAVLKQHSHLADRYQEFLTSIDGALDERQLALLRSQVEWVHGLQAQPADADDEAERVLLQLAELMPYGYRQISDELVAQLQQHFGAPCAVSVMVAAAFFDVNVRLEQAQASRHKHVSDGHVQ